LPTYFLHPTSIIWRSNSSSWSFPGAGAGPFGTDPFTVYEDKERIFGALKAGASGYLLKRAEPGEIIRAINEVKLGSAPMSSYIASRVVESFHESPRPVPKEQNLFRREEEILEELSKGYTTKEIASRFSISAHTVHTHLKNIYEKLHVHSRTEAVLKFLG
jgi:DNA-binding NarL/FixJ family response regulator